MSSEQVTYFGIDLGTTNSAISYVDETGRPTVIRDQANNSDLTPSVVYFENADNVVVGETAKNVARVYPDRVVQRVKRHMGSAREWNFDGKTYTPEGISALILKKLAEAASKHTQTEARAAVITVPAYFGMLERDATTNAGRIAGLDVLGIVPEPVAAALQYDARTDGSDRTILVYDLGGGTFDTTVIKVGSGAIDVLCTDGDQELGGADWDERLLEYLLEELAKAGPADDPRSDDAFLPDLALLAEDTKRQLSNVESRMVPLRFAGATTMVDVTRTTFEKITEDLLDNTIRYTDRTLDKLSQKLGVSDPARSIDDVLLVGGSTLMPAVTARLTSQYGWTPKLHDPHLAVAKGAARYALSKVLWRWDGPDHPTPAQRQQQIDAVARQTNIDPSALAEIGNTRITNVLPKAFGVKLVDTSKPDWRNDPEAASYIEHLVHADETLPSGPRHLGAATVQDNQPAVEIEIYEQAGGLASRELGANKAVDHGNGKITGLPPLPASSPIDIVMNIDDEGRLRVDASEPTSGQALTIEVRISVLSEEQVREQQAGVALLTVRS
jgi:molecular chaperone DnaK